jgi:hypothetical protein
MERGAGFADRESGDKLPQLFLQRKYILRQRTQPLPTTTFADPCQIQHTTKAAMLIGGRLDGTGGEIALRAYHASEQPATASSLGARRPDGGTGQLHVKR